MDYQPVSRQLSERLEIEFHRRPNRWRRRMWLISLVTSLSAVIWLMIVSINEDYTVYESGHVASVHKSFENDCAQCHTSWAPLDRLVSFDNGIHSTSNKKCTSCHDGLSHYGISQRNSVTINTSMSCAGCHREHQGDEGLAVVADRHCVACHSDLKNDQQHSGTIVAQIESFNPHPSTFDHPEFALLRVLKGDLENHTPGKKHDVYALLGAAGKPQDQAVIRFNHKLHLRAVYENGNLVDGLYDENRRLVDLSNRCDRCHELDSARNYMQPINYERHCASCHPLYYNSKGNANGAAGAGKRKPVVPHESIEIVRGFLTNLFEKQVSQTNAAEGKQLQSKILPFPNRPQMTEAQKKNMQELVKQASNYLLRNQKPEKVDDKNTEKNLLKESDQAIRDLNHKFFGLEAAGGCKYCHEVKLSTNSDTQKWSIVPPKIPRKWMPYSKFSHFSHRNVNCVKCHNDVYNSNQTSDVIMTSIQTCRECHSSNNSGATTGIRARCVTCHDFHKHHSHEWTASPRTSKDTK